jgi:uncharacterized protein (DUF2235 family)
MAKNIIICSDGTGNQSNKDRGTNVFKLYESVDLHNQHEQVAIYDDGVGTNSIKFIRILGGALGIGLSRNVRQLYIALARVYQPGDKIFLFGFSRGAFTVRFLAGLINTVGIIDIKNSAINSDAEIRARAYQAFREYHRINRATLEYAYGPIVDAFKYLLGLIYTRFYWAKDANKFRDTFSVPYPKEKNPIHFIGVWDTVCAVGFPLRDIAEHLNKHFYHFTFADHHLNPYIQNAYHALSIDDQRKTFSPYLWNKKYGDEGPDDDKQAREKQTIEQVWFSGVHSNVGGGYPKQGVSLVALNWILRKAESCGMAIIEADKKQYNAHQNVNDKLYDSRSGIHFIYRYAPRDIFQLCNKYNLPVHIHASVFNRIIRETDGYAPGNIPAKFEMVDSELEKCKWPDISQNMQTELGDDTSFLKRVQNFRIARKWLNRVFIATLLYLVYRALPDDLYQNGIAGVVGFFLSEKFTDSLMNQPLWIFGILIFSFISSRLVKRAMQIRFSEFWYKLICEYYPGYKSS